MGTLLPELPPHSSSGCTCRSPSEPCPVLLISHMPSPAQPCGANSPLMHPALHLCPLSSNALPEPASLHLLRGLPVSSPHLTQEKPGSCPLVICLLELLGPHLLFLQKP